MHKQKKIDAGYIRAEQPDEATQSTCHGMGIYEEMPKKHLTKRVE
jgi:hypothetical protein